MSRIFSRSPYIVEIDETGQTSSRVELTIWNGSTEPSDPQYILSKNVPASNITQNIYNVSPYIREYFNFNQFSGNVGAYDTPTSTNFYANVRIKRFATTSSGESELDSTVYTAFDGFGTYEEGTNPDLGQVLLSEGAYTYFKVPSLEHTQQSKLAGSITIDAEVGDVLRYTNLDSGATFSPTVSVAGVKNFDRLYSQYRQSGNKVELLSNGGSVVWTATFKPIEECKYTPTYIDFINRHGAWSRIFMFKTSKESFSMTSNDYNLMQSNVVNYDIREGQKKQFNVNGQESITVSSGWVNEDFGNQLKELLVSERILLNDRPVRCMTTSLDIQTGLNDKTMSYSLDFQFNNEFINSVV